MVTLREFRSKMALLVAAADIAGIWSLSEVTRMLSSFAGEAISTGCQSPFNSSSRRGGREAAQRRAAG